MGLTNIQDMFQEKMSTLFQELECVHTCTDDLPVVTEGAFKDHLTELGVVLNKLRCA